MCSPEASHTSTRSSPNVHAIPTRPVWFRSHVWGICGGGTMTEPQPVMDPVEQNRLTKEVGRAMVRVAGQHWQKIRAEYRSAGRHVEVDLTITAHDGQEHAIRPPTEVVSGFARLRGGMYRPGRGTWLSAAYEIEPPGGFAVEFEPDEEPAWRTVPPPIGFMDELRFFPRSDEHIPDWLRARAGMPPAVSAETQAAHTPAGGIPAPGGTVPAGQPRDVPGQPPIAPGHGQVPPGPTRGPGQPPAPGHAPARPGQSPAPGPGPAGPGQSPGPGHAPMPAGPGHGPCLPPGPGRPAPFPPNPGGPGPGTPGHGPNPGNPNPGGPGPGGPGQGGPNPGGPGAPGHGGQVPGGPSRGPGPGQPRPPHPGFPPPGGPGFPGPPRP